MKKYINTSGRGHTCPPSLVWANVGRCPAVAREVRTKCAASSWMHRWLPLPGAPDPHWRLTDDRKAAVEDTMAEFRLQANLIPFRFLPKSDFKGRLSTLILTSVQMGHGSVQIGPKSSAPPRALTAQLHLVWLNVEWRQRLKLVCFELFTLRNICIFVTKATKIHFKCKRWIYIRNN